MLDKDHVLALAREAGFGLISAFGNVLPLQRFAELVAAKEREACADIVENANTPDCGGWTAQGIADAIRARGGKA